MVRVTLDDMNNAPIWTHPRIAHPDELFRANFSCLGSRKSAAAQSVTASDTDSQNSPNGKVTYKLLADPSFTTDVELFALEPLHGSTKFTLTRTQRQRVLRVHVKVEAGDGARRRSTWRPAVGAGSGAYRRT